MRAIIPSDVSTTSVRFPGDSEDGAAGASMQQRLNFLPLPQGRGSLRPTCVDTHKMVPRGAVGSVWGTHVRHQQAPKRVCHHQLACGLRDNNGEFVLAGSEQLACSLQELPVA